MNRKVGLITFVVFLLFVAAGVVAVLSLGTSTGLQMGGKVVNVGVGTVEAPYRMQAGWIRNNSPWPVTISAINVDSSGTVDEPQIFLSTTDDEPAPVDGAVPLWATTPVELPYTLEGGALRGGAGNRRARGESAGLFEGETPVDSLAAVLQRLLQLPDQTLHHLGVVGQSSGARELRRIELGVAREELAQHLAEVVLRRLAPRLPVGSVAAAGAVPGIVSHAIYASPRPNWQPANSLRLAPRALRPQRTPEGCRGSLSR